MGTTVALPTAIVVENSPELMQAFCVDVAQKIHEYSTIATRYGFPDEHAMMAYLGTNHTVRRRIRELRAIWESDDNVEVRVRRLAGHTVLEALPSTGQMMFNETLTPTARIDALKAHARIAGVDVPPAAAMSGMGAGAGGSRFSVQIVFGSGKVETITTTEDPKLIEGEAT